MSTPSQLKTQRLLLRRWQESDLEPFALINSDPDVMRYFPALTAKEESFAQAKRIDQSFDQNGFGLWAVEYEQSREFIGFVGLQSPRFEAHFTPCVEVGWRLNKNFWGQGLALEAAFAALEDGFSRLKLEEVVSMTTVANAKSRRVMEKLGMTRNPEDDFDHPGIDARHPLRRHVLYRLTAKRFWELYQAN